jgi:hypothetical protein
VAPLGCCIQGDKATLRRRIDVSTILEEKADDLVVAFVRCNIQSGPDTLRRRFLVSPALDQKAENIPDRFSNI